MLIRRLTFCVSMEITLIMIDYPSAGIIPDNLKCLHEMKIFTQDSNSLWQSALPDLENINTEVPSVCPELWHTDSHLHHCIFKRVNSHWCKIPKSPKNPENERMCFCFYLKLPKAHLFLSIAESFALLIAMVVMALQKSEKSTLMYFCAIYHIGQFSPNM